MSNPHKKYFKHASINFTKSEFKLLENVKEITGEKTNTRAVHNAIEGFLEQRQRIGNLEREVRELRSELRQARSLISSFTDFQDKLQKYKADRTKGKHLSLMDGPYTPHHFS